MLQNRSLNHRIDSLKYDLELIRGDLVRKMKTNRASPVKSNNGYDMTSPNSSRRDTRGDTRGGSLADNFMQSGQTIETLIHQPLQRSSNQQNRQTIDKSKSKFQVLASSR